MQKIVIENKLYLFESIKENRMTSYDDNLINSSNNKINNDKLTYIDKNIKSFEVLLNIQKFAQIDNNLKKMAEKLTSNSYTDVTNEWIKNAIPNSHKIEDRQYFEKANIKYQVDGKNVVLDYSNKEKEIAQWLENTLGGEIYMLPRVNKPDGIQTADYLFRGEYWDLKEIKSSGKKVIDNRVNGLKEQTRNFIFDISNNLLSDEEIIN